jgi:excisionase family DNA binding protein
MEKLQKEAKELKEEKMKNLQMLEKRQEPLSVKELAQILGNSPTTIYRRIHNGELEAFRDGWLIKIVPSIAVEWVKQLIAKGCHKRKRNRRPLPRPLTRGENPLEEGKSVAEHFDRQDPACGQDNENGRA